jgi:hypothetical protein
VRTPIADVIQYPVAWASRVGQTPLGELVGVGTKSALYARFCFGGRVTPAMGALVGWVVVRAPRCDTRGPLRWTVVAGGLFRSYRQDHLCEETIAGVDVVDQFHGGPCLEPPLEQVTHALTGNEHVDRFTLPDATAPYPLDHLIERIEILVNGDPHALEVGFDDGVVESVAEVRDRLDTLPIVRGFGVGGNEAKGLERG